MVAVPRTKEFDPDVALDRAMELFWRTGYEGTSTNDLARHLGIGKASLYGTFGNKHDLYVQALRRYSETQCPSAIEILSQPGPALAAVRAYLEGSVASRDGEPGCLIVKAALENCPRDTETAHEVAANWDAIEVALTTTLTRARAEGEIPAAKDPRALARFLLVFLQGVQVVARAEPDTRRLADAARAALDALTA